MSKQFDASFIAAMMFGGTGTPESLFAQPSSAPEQNSGDAPAAPEGEPTSFRAHNGDAGTSPVIAFLAEAVGRALDWVCSGDRRSAQVCVEKGNFPTFVRIEHLADGKLYASSNDSDISIGQGPSLSFSHSDPAAIHDEATGYLVFDTGSAERVDVKLFLHDGMHPEILRGNSADGNFEPMPEFPSL